MHLDIKECILKVGDKLGLLEVLTRVQRLENGVKEISIDDDGEDCDIVVDSELSTISENPVQNKVITSAIGGHTVAINELANTKQDYSPFIRRIYVGNEQTPSNTFGEDGDMYIYNPNQ